MRVDLNPGVETALAFMVRCAGASTLAYELAGLVRLPQPLWAAISAIVVSQERLRDTRSQLFSRIAGTLSGVAVSLAVGALAEPMRWPDGLKMGVAIAIAALLAHRFPNLRVAMWTCPVVLLTAGPGESLLLVAFRRASEVIFGAAVGFALHWLADALLRRFASK